MDSFGAVGGQQFSRANLSRAISIFLQLLDHREQSLRFLADQILDEIFRVVAIYKFNLKNIF
jgi:hypothetical protein